jgi:ABC transporter substrate binding protein (PQQ-dependent alcohol dehydrogenase system)
MFEIVMFIVTLFIVLMFSGTKSTQTMFKLKFKKNILVFITSVISLTASSQTITTDISYLSLDQQRRTNVLNIFNPPKNSGYMGAKLAVDDSNTTGNFLQQYFILNYFTTPTSREFLTYLDSEYHQGRRIFVLDAPSSDLIKADIWAKDKPVLLFNISESADKLRSSQCLERVFHTTPSNAMKSDALAQWLLYRRMNKVLLVHGSKPEDKDLAISFKRSAKRFGLKLIGEKQWDFNTDLRRSTQQEIPLFTQTVQNYDVVYVADKSKTFAEFLPFNTFLPRPVIGSAGLEALAWHGAIEQWGATQLQNRFKELAGRPMNEMDFSAYLAVRSVAQSVHKLHSNDSKKIKNFINSDKFELAAYKGRKLGFRSWNRQLRMPLALVHPHALVSQSPQPGMLHPKTELDTLGFDAQETQCK